MHTASIRCSLHRQREGNNKIFFFNKYVSFADNLAVFKFKKGVCGYIFDE